MWGITRVLATGPLPCVLGTKGEISPSVGSSDGNPVSHWLWCKSTAVTSRWLDIICKTCLDKLVVPYFVDCSYSCQKSQPPLRIQDLVLGLRLLRPRCSLIVPIPPSISMTLPVIDRLIGLASQVTAIDTSLASTILFVGCRISNSARC